MDTAFLGNDVMACKIATYDWSHHLLGPIDSMLEAGYDIRTVQELLGQADVSATMIYAHVLNKGGQRFSWTLEHLERP